MYQRLLLQHRLLRLPYLVHNRFHFCHILFINIPGAVNSLRNLIQITTDFSKRFVVLPQIRIIHIINNSKEYQCPNIIRCTLPILNCLIVLFRSVLLYFVLFRFYRFHLRRNHFKSQPCLY